MTRLLLKYAAALEELLEMAEVYEKIVSALEDSIPWKLAEKYRPEDAEFDFDPEDIGDTEWMYGFLACAARLKRILKGEST